MSFGFGFGKCTVNWPSKEGFTHRVANGCKLKFTLELVQSLGGDHFGVTGCFELLEELVTFGRRYFNGARDLVKDPS